MKRVLALLLPVLLGVVGIVLMSPAAAQADGGVFPVRGSADDAEQRSGRTVLDGSDLRMVRHEGQRQVVGLRFTQVSIPAGATITRAYVQFTASGSTPAKVPLTIHGQASDDPGSFTRARGDVSKRPRTTASASWTPAPWTPGQRGQAQRTSDLTAVVQEIVSRPGWASGNALAVIVDGAGPGKRVAVSFDRNADKAPALRVEWTTGEAPPSAAPTTAALPPAPATEKAPDATTARKPVAPAPAPAPAPEPIVQPAPAPAPAPDPAPAADVRVRFPADSGVVDLGAAPHNVRCDGVTDDTAAIQGALDAYANRGDTATRFSFRTLHLPAGTCLISGSLAAPGNAIRLVGSGQAHTVLRLRDGAAGFGNPGTPKYVYRPGLWNPSTGNANTGYANYVQDLTIDVGSGNPGAVGLRFDGCNSAAVERVTLRAGAQSGLRGLTLESGAGPLQIQDVTVEGFSVGIWGDKTPVNNMVFNDITLTGQRTVAIQNNARVFQFEGLRVSGAPKVYEGAGPQAVGYFLDAELTGPGAGTALSAVTGSYVYARDVTGTGWGNLITTGGSSRFVGKGAITEWASADYLRGDTSVPWSENGPVASVDLPHPAAPESTNYDLSQWAKAAVVSGRDAGPAIQAAIDSGARVVYLPFGNWTVASTVTVRGNVERIDFMGSRVAMTGSAKFVVGDTTADFVVLSHASASGYFEQNGPDTVVLENMGPIMGTGLARATTGPNASGDLFLDNFAASNRFHITQPINTWIRQSNREGQASSVSGGASVWIFGDNLEAHDEKGDPYLTISDSTVEILAGTWDNLADGGRFSSTTGPAAYDVADSQVSILMPGVFRYAAVAGHSISDTEGGATVGDITTDDVLVGPTVGQFRRVVVPLYVSP